MYVEWWETQFRTQKRPLTLLGLVVLVTLLVRSSEALNGQVAVAASVRRFRGLRLAAAKASSPWSGKRNLNEVFFKDEMAKLEKEIAQVEALRKQNDQVMIGSSESTTRRASPLSDALPTPEFTVPKTPEAATAANPNVTRLPFLDSFDSIGLTGRWVERSGNFVLRPPSPEGGDKQQQPLGVIHFLGGAFVGAAPHLTYRYLLESLAEVGYVVVATPYRLDFGKCTTAKIFSGNSLDLTNSRTSPISLPASLEHIPTSLKDYVRSCDAILTKFDAVAVELAADYGPVPVIGLGHSCGALLQVLITSLFPDAPRAANVLISFNNRKAGEAIPGLDELVVPLSEALMQDTEQGTNFRGALSSLRSALEATFLAYADSAVAPSFVGKEILPLLKQGTEIVDQIPPLLREIASGRREFVPSPIDAKEVCRRMYRARRTLLLKFDNDDLDESVGIEKVLREANTIMRMKRPMVEMEVELRVLSGTHITPLTQNIFLETPEGLPDLLEPLRTRVRTNFLQTVDEVRNAILGFLSPLSDIKSM